MVQQTRLKKIFKKNKQITQFNETSTVASYIYKAKTKTK